MSQHNQTGGTPTDDQTRVVRPKAIDIAFRFAIVGTVFGAIGTVVTMLLDREWVTTMVREVLDGTAQPYGEHDVVASIGLFRTIGGVSIAIFVGLFVLFAVKMRAGRNWARIVLTGYALFGMVNFLTAASASGAALDLIWSLAGVAFTVAAVVYMFRPESLTFFSSHKNH